MPRKTFTAGEVLAAADVNNFLMDQSVMTFADSTARGSAIGTATEGMLTYLADTNAYEYWDGTAYEPLVAAGGGAWTAFTPTWNGLTVGNGVYNQAHYSLVGKTATFAIDFSLGSTSAVTGAVNLTLPEILARKNAFATGSLYSFFTDFGNTDFLGFPRPDTSASRVYAVFATSVSGTNVNRTTLSATVPFTWAANDRIVYSGTIEVA
jgi:hypothetical protein